MKKNQQKPLNVTSENRMPGDPHPEKIVETILRVDHAGEHGAIRIYQGQLAVLSGTKAEAPIREMMDQEQRHLDKFNQLIADRKVRPTALSPLWHVAGFMLGAGTAFLGPKAAMTCTQAVEEVIDEHYESQAKQLGDDENELRAVIEEFRKDEQAHRDKAIEEGAEETPGHKTLSRAIKGGTKLAIWLSKKV
tara:strand:- start:146 stop:721 length:576 start_codon:yes stop_codon:yes gene_type:complete